jgi:NADH:ubiquinone oxidoreductase subunit 6 (subunit J)
MMTLALIVIAALTLAAAAVALTLRNLIHSALLLIVSWAGIAAFYLWAGAEFVAFAQVLIYVGAISMVVLFAVLLTRHSHTEPTAAAPSSRRLLAALTTGGALLGVLWGAVVSAPLQSSPAAAPVLTVRDLGLQLMGPHAAALLVVGALLTVALIGAVVIAATSRRRDPREESP